MGSVIPLFVSINMQAAVEAATSRKKGWTVGMKIVSTIGATNNNCKPYSDTTQNDPGNEHFHGCIIPPLGTEKKPSSLEYKLESSTKEINADDEFFSVLGQNQRGPSMDFHPLCLFPY